MKLSLFIKAMNDVMKHKGDIECVFITTHNRYSGIPSVASVDAADQDDKPIPLMAVFGYPGDAREMPPESIKHIDDFRARTMIDATTGKPVGPHGFSVN